MAAKRGAIEETRVGVTSGKLVEAAHIDGASGASKVYRPCLLVVACREDTVWKMGNVKGDLQPRGCTKWAGLVGEPG